MISGKPNRSPVSNDAPLAVADLAMLTTCALIVLMAATLQKEQVQPVQIDQFGVNLAASTGKGAPSQGLVITIDADGQIMIEDELINRTTPGIISDELLASIAERASANSEALLFADPDAPYGIVVELEVALHKADVPYKRNRPPSQKGE